MLEYSINKDTIGICSTIFEGNVSQPIDLDFNLPDYCPDIQKILKCQAYPRILREKIENDKIDVEGIFTISLIYLDAEKMVIHSCEYTSPFNVYYKLKKPLDSKNIDSNMLIFSKTNIEYINCRAITQRRLDIHGEFSVKTTLKTKNEQEIPSNIDGENIEQKTSTISLNSLRSMTQKEFSIAETFQLEKDLLPIETIINSSLSVKLKDYRAITNKLILNCTAKLSLLYISDIETGEINNLSHDLEFSQIIDVDDLQDEGNCCISITPVTHDINVKSDTTGETGLIALDAKVLASACYFESKETCVLKDAYSTSYKSIVQKKDMSLNTFLKQISPTYIHETTIDLNSINAARIIDLRNELSSAKAIYDGENIKFTGKYNICVFYINVENETAYFEKVIDFEYTHSFSEDEKNLVIEPRINIEYIDYKLKENKNLEINTNITLDSIVYESKKISSIEKLDCDEESPVSNENKAPLTLYYADSGEKIWDIAKKYYISELAIREENELTDEESLSSKTMILIPTK